MYTGCTMSAGMTFGAGWAAAALSRRIKYVP
jgi:hypothetical protein